MTSEELVSKKDFKQAKKRGPVLLDFYTVWCGPCKVQAQILKEHGDKIKEHFAGLQIYRVDITNKKDCSNQFFVDFAKKIGIRSIPQLILFNKGAKLGHAMKPGTKSPERIIEFLKQYLDDSR